MHTMENINMDAALNILIKPYSSGLNSLVEIKTETIPIIKLIHEAIENLNTLATKDNGDVLWDNIFWFMSFLSFQQKCLIRLSIID